MKRDREEKIKKHKDTYQGILWTILMGIPNGMEWSKMQIWKDHTLLNFSGQ